MVTKAYLDKNRVFSHRYGMLDDSSTKIASFKAIFENMIFLSTLLSLCSAQVLKGIIYILNSRRRKKKRELVEVLVWRTGGMPSSHAAVVSSLCTSIALVRGIASDLFIFSFWFALVVLRDAMGVRLSTGLLAKGLNNLGRQVSEKTGLDFHPVKEIQGHTPMEVVIGGLLGIFIAAGLHLF